MIYPQESAISAGAASLAILSMAAENPCKVSALHSAASTGSVGTGQTMALRQPSTALSAEMAPGEYTQDSLLHHTREGTYMASCCCTLVIPSKALYRDLAI